MSSLDKRQFYFVSGVNFVEGNEDELRAHAEKLRTLLDDAGSFDYTVSVTVAGSTDSYGDAAGNVALASRRAALAAGILTLSGIDARISGQPDTELVAGQAQEDVSKRYVRVDLQLEPSLETP